MPPNRKEYREMDKTRFRLNICGVEIIVSGDVDEAATQEIAGEVRARMQSILSAAYTTSVEKAAVITAMNLCEELARQNTELEAVRAHIAELEDEVKALRENHVQTEPVQTKIAETPENTVPKQPLRNPLRPDLGDQTGLVSFFAREDAADDEEE